MVMRGSYSLSEKKIEREFFFSPKKNIHREKITERKKVDTIEKLFRMYTDMHASIFCASIKANLNEHPN
jgi:hypothetical protein